MKDCFITFRSVTFAQRGERELKRAGVTCSVQRTPQWMEQQGCGYSIRLRCQDIMAAVEVLKGDKAVSVLPVGVVRIEGEFEKDDIVKIMNQEGMPIGVGRVAFDSVEARQMIGKHGQKPLVHYDYLYLE